jgi:hypothetical protein
MSKKKLAESYSAVDQFIDQQEFVESVEKAFKGISDPRVLDDEARNFFEQAREVEY